MNGAEGPQGASQGTRVTLTGNTRISQRHQRLRSWKAAINQNVGTLCYEGEVVPLLRVNDPASFFRVFAGIVNCWGAALSPPSFQLTVVRRR